MSRTSFTLPLITRATPMRPAQLRQMNARALLHLLQHQSPCSKADLVRSSGLSTPTVSSGVTYLQSLGLVEHLGDGESSGGRPPGLLRFNAAHGCVAAADIGGTSLRLMLADLAANVIAHSTITLALHQKTPETIVALIVDGLNTMCKQTGTPIAKLLHLTAGAPGITNAATGTVLSAPNLDRWTDIPLRLLLEAALAIPCLVENDTNLAALGESYCGAARSIPSFVFIALGTGVGAGIFLNGRLHHGAHWNAGEIGYFGICEKRRPPMNLHHLGQLEQAIGGAGIQHEWRCRLQKKHPIPPPNLIDLKPSQIFDLASAADPLALSVVHWVAAILAEAIADIALLLNPEVVVLGGGVGAHPELCRATAKLLHQHQFALPLLRSSALGTHAQLQGALSLSLSAVENKLLR